MAQIQGRMKFPPLLHLVPHRSGLGDEGGSPGTEITFTFDGKYAPALGWIGPPQPGVTYSVTSTPGDIARMQGIIAAADNAAQSAQAAATAYQQQQAAQALRDLQSAQQAALQAIQQHQLTIPVANPGGPATAQPVAPGQVSSTSGDAVALAAANAMAAAAQQQATFALRQAALLVQQAQQAAAAATTQAQANAAQAALDAARVHQQQVVDTVQSWGTGALPVQDIAGVAGGGTFINAGTSASGGGMPAAFGQVPPLYLYAGAAIAAVLLLRR